MTIFLLDKLVEESTGMTQVKWTLTPTSLVYVVHEITHGFCYSLNSKQEISFFTILVILETHTLTTKDDESLNLCYSFRRKK